MSGADRPSCSCRLLLAALLVFAVIGFGGLNPYLSGGGDNAEYIAQAEALVTLGHRANLNEYGSPSEKLKPPLFPCLLAPFVACAGRNVILLKAVVVAFGLGAVWAAWWALSAALDSADPGKMGTDTILDGQNGVCPHFPPAAFLALWFALTPLLGLHAHDVLSDVPFTFVALVCFGLAARAVRPAASWRPAAALAACLVAGTALRSAGVLVAGACAAFALVEAGARRRGENGDRYHFRRTKWYLSPLSPLSLAGLLLAVALGLLLWQQWLARGYVTPGQFIEGFLRPASAAPESGGWARLGRLAFFYALSLPGGVAVHGGFAPYHPIPILGGLVAIVGAVSLLRRGQRLVPVCWACCQVPLLFLPFEDPRYNLPALPLYLALLWSGGKTLLGAAARRGRTWGAFAVFGLSLCSVVSLLGVLLGFGELDPAPTTPPEWVCGILLAGLLAGWAAFGTPQAPAPLELLPRRLGLATAGVFLALALSRSASENLVREHRWGPAPPGPGWRGFYEAAGWLKEHAAPGEAVVSARPSLVWYWSGLPGLYIPKTAEQELAPAQWIIRDNVGEDDPAGKFLDPYLQARRAEWEIVWRTPTLDAEGRTAGWTWILRRRAKEALPPAAPR